MARVVVGDVEVAYLEAGRGGRPLLVLHGFTGAKEDFADHLPALAEAGWHVVAPDLRGHGETSKPDDEAAYSFEALRADALGLVDHLGWDRFVLAGHSMGGMVAQVLALDHPDRVAGLVLLGTGHGPLEGLDPELVAVGVELVRAGGIPAFRSIVAGVAGFDFAGSEVQRRLRRERPGFAEYAEAKVDRCSPAMLCALVPAMIAQQDRLARLGHLDVPTLVLVGEDDVFLEACRRMAATIPGARLVVLDDAAHSPHFEAPDAWRAEVLAFLANL